MNSRCRRISGYAKILSFRTGNRAMVIGEEIGCCNEVCRRWGEPARTAALQPPRRPGRVFLSSRRSRARRLRSSSTSAGVEPRWSPVASASGRRSAPIEIRPRCSGRQGADDIIADVMRFDAGTGSELGCGHLSVRAADAGPRQTRPPSFEQKMSWILRLEDQRILHDPTPTPHATATPPPPALESARGRQPSSSSLHPPPALSLIEFMSDREGRSRRRCQPCGAR